MKRKEFEHLIHWMTERNSIRLQRNRGLPPPWTTDAIIANYRFCNVRRMDDKVSQWLEAWHKENIARRNKRPKVSSVAVACMAGRLINRIESLQRLPYPLPYDEAAWTEGLLNIRRDGQTVFTGAYVINGALGGDKILQVTQKVLRPLWEARNQIPTDGHSMRMVHASLNNRPGIASFMAGQAVADLRWVLPDLPWEDRHTWAPRGPGSARGVNRLLGRELEATMKFDDWLKHLLDLYAATRERLPKMCKRLELMDFQNCMCEFDKYRRLMRGEGSVRSKYVPRAA